MAVARTYTTRDPAFLARVLVPSLCVYAATAAVNIVAGAIQVGSLAQMPPGAPMSLAESTVGGPFNEILYTVSNLGVLAAFLLAGFLTLKWIYRSSRNAHAIEQAVARRGSSDPSFRRDMSVSPPWAVGWFFVPIAFLWKPFEALRETWQVSTDPVAWTFVLIPNLLRWWWGLWLLENILGNVALRLSLSFGTVEGQLLSDLAQMAQHTVAVAATLALILIVQRLTGLQVAAINAQRFD